jgi:hypothetical protein
MTAIEANDQSVFVWSSILRKKIIKIITMINDHLLSVFLRSLLKKVEHSVAEWGEENTFIFKSSAAGNFLFDSSHFPEPVASVAVSTQPVGG